jgi:isopentenyldiphosphate isomerase
VDPSEFVRSLRSQVTQADYLLTPAAYAEVIHLFDACASDPAFLSALRTRSPEWNRREFLLNVDAQGRPAVPTDELLADLRRAIDGHPDLANWFQEGQVSGRPVLLVARWLCHLAGLRHRTVQLFLDHPTAAGYTLLQVRGFDKAEAPGCFDMPCAGHVTGLETVEEALFKELEEELGLHRSDISLPQALGSYVYCGPEGDPGLYNVEYCAVYRSHLLPGALPRIRFVDREVAALSIFAVPEVQRLIGSSPQCVASGLAGSWSLYFKSRS